MNLGYFTGYQIPIDPEKGCAKCSGASFGAFGDPLPDCTDMSYPAGTACMNADGSQGTIGGQATTVDYGPDANSPPQNAAQLNSTMDQGISVLRVMLAQAASQTGSVASAIGTQNVQQTVQDNLVKDATYINQLDTTLRQQVLSGVSAAGNPYPLSSWLGFANNVAQDIQTQQGVSIDSSAWNTYLGAAGATFTQVTNFIQQIPQQIANALPKIGAGLGIVLGLGALVAVGYFFNAYSKVKRHA